MLLVGQAAEEFLQVGRGIAQGSPSTLDAKSAHQSGHPVLTYRHAQLLQPLIYPGTAIGTATGLMHSLDLAGQRLILLRTMAGATTAPGIKPGTGDAIHTAHQRDGMVFPVRFEKRYIATRLLTLLSTS